MTGFLAEPASKLKLDGAMSCGESASESLSSIGESQAFAFSDFPALLEQIT
jgi:hypothetical protein